MDSIRSSYDFHLRLEPFPAFVRREWGAIALSTGAFAVVMLAAIFLIDPAFFYPRLQTDPLNYYLKAQVFARTGSSAAKWAVNLDPFPYAAMPGLLRAPAVLLFKEFDDQLRAMQVMNIPIVVSVAVMSAYILSWVLPPRQHRLAIMFAFAFTFLSPIWIANVFLPLADAPYAASTLAAVILSISIFCSERQLRHRPVAIAALAALFAVAFTLRFTAPVLLVFAAILARGHWSQAHVSKRGGYIIGAGAIVFLALLIRVNAEAIFGRYFVEPLFFLVKADKPGMVINLLSVALPSQVVPNFVSGFVHPPIDAHYYTNFAASTADTIWMLLGFLISLVIVAGIWPARRKLLPEIAYVLVPIPVLALILPSTTRYLMTYQPFIWIFFYSGMITVAQRSRAVDALFRNRVAVAGIAIAALACAVGLRLWRLGGSSSERSLAVTVSAAPSYISDVSQTFRGLRRFVETLPEEKTLLVGDHGTTGRWKAISGREYYFPDSGLARAAAQNDVYVLAECGQVEVCQGWSYYKESVRKRVEEFGRFEFDSVYALESPRAKVQVYRIHPIASP